MTRQPLAARARRVAWATLGAVLLASIAACGSGNGDTGAGSGPVDPSGLAAAEAKYEELKAPPKDVWIPTEQLSESMAGKTFYFIYIAGPPAFQQALEATTEANAAVRAKTVPLTFIPGTDELAARLKQALEAKPAGVFISGAPSSTITAQLAAFKKARIPVVSQATREKDDDTLGFTGYDWAYTMCAGNAAVAIADSGGKADALQVGFPEVAGIDNGCKAGYQDYVEKNCPACRVEYKPFTLADQAANKNPQIVTGLLQSRPDTKYVVWQGANSVPGVPQALTAAGIKGVTQLSFGGDVKTWSDIRDGGQLGDLVYDIQYIGYRSADLMYRLVAGDDVSEASKDNIPTQFLTKDTVPPAGETRWYLPEEYASKFQATWGVS